MSAGKKAKSFEEALSGLERSVESLRSDAVTLEQALKSFEQGVACYEQCAAMLRESKQKIERFNAKTGETEQEEEV
jgi:exodeoxyribonuclease VII small subunit